MNEKRAIAYFVSQTIGHARVLPLQDALNFLKGLLLVADLHDGLEPLRAVYADLCALDQHLAALQLQLTLSEAKP